MIKPVYQRYSQKNSSYSVIKGIFQQAKRKNFAEVFGGTGYISINIREDLNQKQVVKVLFNDFDGMLPVTFEKASNNWCTYQGIGKSSLPSNEEKASKRMNSNEWTDRIQIYNEKALAVEVHHDRSYLTYDFNKDWFVFLDPPGWDDVSKFAMTVIDHIALYKKIKQWDAKGCNFLLIYKYDADLRHLYSKDFKIAKVNDWLYVTNFVWHMTPEMYA